MEKYAINLIDADELAVFRRKRDTRYDLADLCEREAISEGFYAMRKMNSSRYKIQPNSWLLAGRGFAL